MRSLLTTKNGNKRGKFELTKSSANRKGFNFEQRWWPPLSLLQKHEHLILKLRGAVELIHKLICYTFATLTPFVCMARRRK